MDKYEERFWSKVNRTSTNICWEFPNPNSDGYGTFHLEDHKSIKAHRYAWELTRKCRVPKGKLILHMCNNRACINPDHLYCGDAKDNARDRSASAHEIIRCTRISLTKAKFYAGEIWLIRRLKEHYPSRFVAKMFRCDKGTVLNIWKSANWPCREGRYA